MHAQTLAVSSDICWKEQLCDSWSRVWADDIWNSRIHCH